MSLAAQKSSLFGNAGNKKSDKKAPPGGSPSTAPSSTVPNATAKPTSTAPSSSSSSVPLKSTTTSGTTVPKVPTVSAKSSSIVTPSQKAKKVAEATEFVEKATQALKKTIFNWKPDHLTAAPNFESAANSYKMADELDLAHSMMLKSVDSHEHAGTLAAAALTCVKAAQIAQMMARYDLASADWERSAELWGVNGDLDKCAETLAKAAKELINVQPVKALALYRRACDLICAPETPPETMGRLHPSAIAIMRDTLAFMLSDKCRQEDTGKARSSTINTIKDGSALTHAKRLVQLYQGFEMESSMCKTMCAVTVIQLTMGDIVQADHTYLQEHLGNKQYIVSRECRLAEDFIMAIKTHDIDKMDAALSNTDINYLEPREVIFLCKKLSVFSSESAAASSSSPSAERKLYKAADQMAQDMADLMKMAPKHTTEETATSAAGASLTAAKHAAQPDDDDEEWVPSSKSPQPRKQTPIVDDDDDDDELDLT